MEHSKLILLALIAFIIRLYFTTLHDVVELDFYIILGINLISGKGFVGYNDTFNLLNMPMYPLMIGLFSLFIQNLEFAARLISVIFGSFLVFPVFFLGRELYNKTIGYIASIFLVFYFWLVDYSATVSSESTYLFFLTCGVFFGYLGLIKETKFLYLITGIFLGLCYLTRTEGFGYVGIIILLSFVFWLFEKRNVHNLKKLIIRILCLLTGFLVISSPYIISLHRHTGHWTLSEGGAFQLIPGESYGDRNKYEMARSGLIEDKTKTLNEYYLGNVDIIDYVTSHVFELFKRYLRNLRELLTTDIPATFPIWLLPLIGLGLFREKWDKRRLKGEFYMMSIVLYPLLLFPIFFISPRYLFPIIPFMLIWVAKGTYELQRWFEKSGYQKIIKNKLIKNNIATILVLISLFPPFIAYYSFFLSDQPVEYKNAGLWLKDNAPEKHPVIMSRKPWIAFYADGIYVALPYANYTDTMIYAKHKNVDYVVIDERFIPERRPQLAYLLNESNAPKNLKLVYKNEEKPNRKILIYKILNYD